MMLYRATASGVLPGELPFFSGSSKRVWLVLFSLASISFGCCIKPRTIGDEATTHLAVVSVGRFEDYVESLAPAFELSAENALKKAVPTTRLLENQSRQSLAAGLAVGFPALSGESSEGSGSKEGGGETLKPTAKFWESDNAIASEPMMQYWAATALYQEVQILKRYVRDAAGRRDARAYIVRLQLNIMPRRRNQPLDVFCTMSFFKGPYGEVYSKKNSKNHPEVSKGEGEAAEGPKAPFVIPLMVTDNLEATLGYRSSFESTRLAFSLLAALKGVGVQADFEDYEATLKAMLGRDLNSLLTVGRVSDNTIRVRLGAIQSTNGHSSLVPRNHFITVLLLVPDEKNDETQGRMRVVGDVELIDVYSGLPAVERGTLEEVKANRERRRKIMEFYAADWEWEGVDLEADEVDHMLAAVWDNDLLRFRQELRKLIGPEQYGDFYDHDALWLDFATYMLGQGYVQAEFDLPDPWELEQDPAGKGPLPVPRQNAICTDDGSATTILLGGGRNLTTSDGLGAELVFQRVRRTKKENEEKAQVDRQTIQLRPRKIEILNRGQTIKCVFPPLRDFLAETSSSVEEISLYLSVQDRKSGGGRAKSPPYPGVYVKKETNGEKPGLEFEMAVSTACVVADSGGEGTLQIRFKRKEKAPDHGHYSYKVEGAGWEVISDNGPKNPKERGVVLKLTNLSPAHEVRITARREKEPKIAHSPITLPVVTAWPGKLVEVEGK